MSMLSKIRSVIPNIYNLRPVHLNSERQVTLENLTLMSETYNFIMWA